MSYIPNTWASGDVVTAQKMNNIENGIASIKSAMVIHNSIYDPETYRYGPIEGYSDIITELMGGTEVYINIYNGEQIILRFNIVAWMYQDMYDEATDDDSSVLTFIGIDNNGSNYWFPETDYNPNV